MEPITDPDLAEVMRREVELLRPEVRADADAVLALLHPAWFEFGASGRVWDAPALIAAMAADASAAGSDGGSAAGIVCRLEDAAAVRLAPGVVLLTYTAHDPGRVSRRSSVWVRDGDGPWLMRFHQGTVVPRPAAEE